MFVVTLQRCTLIDPCPNFGIGVVPTLGFSEFSTVQPRFAPVLCWSTSRSTP